MDQVQITKQVIDLQKTTFDNMLGNMLLYWAAMTTDLFSHRRSR